MTLIANKYPESFEVLNQETKNKAIEIAELLVKKGLKQEQAQCIAVANLSFGYNNSIENNDVHLIPHPVGWVLASTDAIIFHFICSSLNEALGRARNKAKCEKLKLFIHSLEGNIVDAESFKVNRPIPGYIQQSIVEENTWVVKTEVESRSCVFNSKREALQKEKFLAKRSGSRLFSNSQTEGKERNLSFEI